MEDKVIKGYFILCPATVTLFVHWLTWVKILWTSTSVVVNCPADKYLWHTVGGHRNRPQSRKKPNRWVPNLLEDLHSLAPSIFRCFFVRHVLVTSVCSDCVTCWHKQLVFDEMPISPDIRFVMTENQLILFSLLAEPVKMFKWWIRAYSLVPSPAIDVCTRSVN